MKISIKVVILNAGAFFAFNAGAWKEPNNPVNPPEAPRVEAEVPIREVFTGLLPTTTILQAGTRVLVESRVVSFAREIFAQKNRAAGIVVDTSRLSCSVVSFNQGRYGQGVDINDGEYMIKFLRETDEHGIPSGYEGFTRPGSAFFNTHNSQEQAYLGASYNKAYKDFYLAR